MSSASGVNASSQFLPLMSATSSLTQGLSSFASGYAQSSAYQMQAGFQKQQYELNKEIADIQADDALERGKKAVTQHKKEVKNLIGKQRASLAAQGIELDSGSALSIQEDTAYMGALDAITIRNNAARESWGYKAQAASYGMMGRFAEIGGNAAARSSLLTGGLQAVGYSNKAIYDYYKG